MLGSGSVGSQAKITRVPVETVYRSALNSCKRSQSASFFSYRPRWTIRCSTRCGFELSSSLSPGNRRSGICPVEGLPNLGAICWLSPRASPSLKPSYSWPNAKDVPASYPSPLDVLNSPFQERNGYHVHTNTGPSVILRITTRPRRNLRDVTISRSTKIRTSYKTDERTVVR